jgi:hypothetical protein
MYDYFELSFQSAQKIGYYNGNIDFVLDNDKSMLNQEVELNGKKTYVTILKTVMIDCSISQILKDHIYLSLNAIFTVSVIALIDNGEAFIKRNAKMMWRKTANSRIEMPEYVERSYHEALEMDNIQFVGSGYSGHWNISE